MNHSIWIGWDPREAAAYSVARHSLLSHMSRPVPTSGLVLSSLQQSGLYTRPIQWRQGVERRIMWDALSDAPMSTQHACARFLVPHLARTGWAMFTDGDVLFRGDASDVFRDLDPAIAIYCVKHKFNPPPGVKMDGQEQTRYARKCWSSVMLINCDHDANRALTLDTINTLPGRDLHRFCWLSDEHIGELHPRWNYLVGHTSIDEEPAIVHFTEGTPDMFGYEDCEYSDEWRTALDKCAAFEEYAA